MKTIVKFTILLASVALLAGCFRNDIRTETFQIDQLRNEEAARLISASMNGLPGIKDVRADIENRQLTIEFDGLQIYLKNLEYEIVKAGFDLPHWPADPADKAKLPPELQ